MKRLSKEKNGAAALDEAVRIVAVKNPDNPKRTLAYLLSTAKHLSEAGAQ